MNQITRTLGFLFILFFWVSPAQAEETPIPQVERYFPDEVGMSWSYRGSVVDDVQRVGAYINTAAVKGTAQKKGAQVKIFTESNQADEGPAESYFVRDAEGISYFGGQPTTPFESQLVPYRVIRFPLVLNKPFSQIDKSISFGRDLDEDGTEEVAVVQAEIVALGFETVSVPAGVFKDSLKLEGRMKIFITLSSNGKVLLMTDKTTNWFAPDVGMVKGIEKTEFPSPDGSNPTGSIITEELSEYSTGRSSVH